MRRFRWVAETFIIALIVMPCAGISAPADSRAERELRDLERERSRAIREHDEAAIATHVWLRRGGRWQIVAAQATPVRRS